ncbi:MAG: cupin domain-containing protein [Pseudomonadota bacterium]
MSAHLKSSAPHIHKASTWADDLVDWGDHMEPIDGRSKNSGRLLWAGAENRLPEAGIWVCTPGSWHLVLPRDELCHFVSGRATYRAESGEAIEVTPGTVVHFIEGWTGDVEVQESLRCIYMFR